MLTLPFDLPADTQELRAGDVDGDGRDELVVVSRTPRPGAPSSVKLTILHIEDNGVLGGRSTIDLGTRATFWCVDHGLWAVDAEGLVRFDDETPTRVARFPTALAGLGPTTPAWAPLAHDLDGDGTPELLAWSAGRYLAFRTDGTSFGSIPAPAEGSLTVDWSTGGASTPSTLTPPALAVVDLDGDGKRDLLLPSGARAAAYYTGSGIGARAATLTLPVDVEPVEEDPKPGVTRRRVAAVWIEDMDGDKKADLAVQRIVLAGSWFGAKAELLWAKGRGDGYGALTTIALPGAAFGVDLVDLDGDGDSDFLAPVVDVGIGTIARALVAKEARVELTLFRMNQGVFAAGQSVRVFGFPLEQPGRFQASFDGDVDGDGVVDLVTNDAQDRVRVYRGAGGALAATPAWDVPLAVPTGGDTIFVHDLTGDGKAEIVVWGPKEARASVLRLP
jgi:hypothetical protein